VRNVLGDKRVQHLSKRTCTDTRKVEIYTTDSIETAVMYLYFKQVVKYKVTAVNLSMSQRCFVDRALVMKKEEEMYWGINESSIFLKRTIHYTIMISSKT